jgi:hypothetical protein
MVTMIMIWSGKRYENSGKLPESVRSSHMIGIEKLCSHNLAAR